MWRIGLTGSMATGKSTVLAAFAEAGAAVFSADEAVHRLYAGPASASIEALFEGTVVDGVVDRTRLAQALARAPDRLAELEALVHPLVRDEIAKFMDDAEAAGEIAAVVEVPLLFESGHDYGFNAIAVTHVEDAVQRERALARPGMTVEKFEGLLARQRPQADKRARATYLFDTGRPRHEVEDMVHALMAAIKARAKGKG